MLTVNYLRQFGANVGEGLARCMNNEAFYLKLVTKAVSDPAFDSLAEAVGAGDAERAFALAHSLKGVTANLALTPLLTPVAALTEMFRNGPADGAEKLVGELRAKRAELLSEISSQG